MAYYRQTAPLIGYYHAKGKLRTVDGLESIDTIQREITDPPRPVGVGSEALPDLRTK